MEPTKEQIKWLWEQCGLQADKLPCLIIDCEKERSHALCKDCHALYPDIGLNSLFKYAVPKLDGYIMFASDDGVRVIASSDCMNYEAINENPALALFWAIFQCLGGK